MNLEFEYLADRPELVELVIAWWGTVWQDRMGDVDEARAQLRASLGRDRLPVHILAMRDGEPIGTAALKLQELIELYPDRQFWLGSVYVKPEFRGAGVASELALRVIELARVMGLPHLHLQTIDTSGGLYYSLGWEPVERFISSDEDTLLMVKQLQ